MRLECAVRGCRERHRKDSELCEYHYAEIILLHSVYTMKRPYKKKTIAPDPRRAEAVKVALASSSRRKHGRS